jgi:D-alanyl-D-alanine carboxypeptidase
MSIAVGLPGGETWTAVAGHAEFTPRRKIERDTVFAIASVTKTFIAALVLQLAEEGKLSLDDVFGIYGVEAPRSRTVTIRQLLSHTSGIYNYFENKRYQRFSSDRDHRWTYEEIIALVKSGYCKPGTCYHYSNTNFVILGEVARMAGGAPLNEQLRQRFFEPLGMDDTIYQPDDPTPLDAAHGHWRQLTGGYIDHTRSARVIPFMSAASVASSAGAIASTASDLATWARALYGGDVLARGSLREMTTFLLEGTYGFGTDVALFGGKRAVGHRGGLRGYESSMWYFPREDLSVVLLSNQGNWGTDAPFDRIATAVFRDR